MSYHMEDCHIESDTPVRIAGCLEVECIPIADLTWQSFPIDLFDLLARIELAEYKDVSLLGRTLYDTVDWNLTQAEIQGWAKVSL